MMVLRPAVILNVGTLAVLLWGVPMYSLSPILVGICACRFESQQGNEFVVVPSLIACIVQ